MSCPAKPWTYERVLSRCIEEGDCQLWQGSVDGGGYAQARIDGKIARVARWVLEDMLGRPIRPKRVATPKCGNRNCCSKLCLSEATVSKVMKKVLANKIPSPTEVANRRAALIRQGRTVLTMEKARELRSRTESGAKLEAEFGCHRDTINKARAGKSWKAAPSSVFDWRPGA